jgi:MSHA biogenesis protein MshP
MKTRSTIAGAALVSAIFLIVVLVALGASMMSLTNVEHETATKSLLAVKVYYGAKSGLEWGIQQAISDPSPPTRCASASMNSAFPSALTAPGLEGVNITISCEAAQFGTGTTAYTFYNPTTATIGPGAGGLGYAARRMQATVANIP